LADLVAMDYIFHGRKNRLKNVMFLIDNPNYLYIIMFRKYGWPVFGAVDEFESQNMIVKNSKLKSLRFFILCGLSTMFPNSISDIATYNT